MAHQPFHLPSFATSSSASFSTEGPARAHTDHPPEGERWSTWDAATHGPSPRPPWVVTELAAVDADLGILRSGKEADIHLVQRWVPGRDMSVIMAAKRYRSSEHRLFHRDAGYLEGRRVRRSRESRAMARRTDFGRTLIAGQWAHAEFATLCRLWEADVCVPYPVQLDEQEMLLEFIGTGAVAAPPLQELRAADCDLPDLFAQLRSVLRALVDLGWAHGDLSPYNTLFDQGRLVVIDWPQVVDIVSNPQGLDYLARDVMTMCSWFSRKGLTVDAGELIAELVADVVG